MLNPLSLLTLKWKIILYVVAFAVILYAGRQWLNKHDSRVEAEARARYSQELEQAKQREWVDRERDLATRSAAVDAARAELDKTLQESLAAIQKEKERNRANACSIPSGQLSDALRDLSRRLAGLQAE